MGRRPGRPKTGRWDGNGNRARRDYGTDELRLKKALVARGADPAQTGHPLQLAAARELVTGDEARAGFWYAMLRARVLGRGDLSLTIYKRYVKSPPSPEDGESIDPARVLDDDEAHTWFRRLRDEIDERCGRQARDQLVNLVIYHRWPGWLLNNLSTVRERRQHRKLREVLGACLAMRGRLYKEKGWV